MNWLRGASQRWMAYMYASLRTHRMQVSYYNLFVNLINMLMGNTCVGACSRALRIIKRGLNR